ncbi:hypothetical protein BTS2_0060 [Bacillus sp. TS-2]|nr:hypothetical protein BTS2_0060 [Bacillus sp. TS-2]
MNQEQLDIKTPEYVSIQFQLAGLGSRSIAFVIDQLILTIFSIVFSIVYLNIIMRLDSLLVFMDVFSTPFMILLLFLFVVNQGYYIIYEYVSGGKTIGKKIIGIRVMQENGHSITFLSSLIRNLLRFVDSLPAAYLVGLLCIFFHSKHKRLGDIVGGTIVVHERRTKKKKKSLTDKEIEKRNLATYPFQGDEYALSSINEKEWKMLKIYTDRFHKLDLYKRSQLTDRLSDALFPKLNISTSNLTNYDKENQLFIVYMKIKDNWEYEL